MNDKPQPIPSRVIDDKPSVVGGGPKKVLYTLKTLKRIGLMNSAKALNSRNACKACGLGMGGQRGGMTNEKNEFPSVCNKSIQAQSTDIQAPIPEVLFEQHSLDDFKQLSPREIEHLGRLNTPLFKAAESEHYQPLTWENAIQLAADHFRSCPPSRSFFYASGRSSNEAGFLLQLIARLYGTNNVNNCSYYCHQATGVGLANVIGSGTATVSLEMLSDSDCIFVIGANPASNHPRFIYQLLACRERGGDVVVINPAKEPGLVKFAVPKSALSMLKGGSEVASHYLQPRIGGDLALLYGLAKALLDIPGAIAQAFIDEHCENSHVFISAVEQLTWPDIVAQSGIEEAQIRALAALYARSKATVFAWGMGITHHRHGVDNVEAIANLALLRGMLGKAGAGLLPLRGHSNVQGMGTVGVKPELAAPVLQAMENHWQIELPRTPGLDTIACLRAAHAGEMDVALLLGGNLYAGSPNTDWARAALDRIPFKVYLTTTLNQGHVHGMENSAALILPVCARDEEAQATTQESMFNYVRMSDGGIQRLGGVRPESDILCDFAQRLLPASRLDFSELRSHRSLRAAIAKLVPGMSALADIDDTQHEFTIPKRVLTTPTFNRQSGKARFTKAILPQQDDEEFPYLLASVRSEGQFNSIIYEEHDSYRQTHSRWLVMMNAEDIASLKLGTQSRVNLRSRHGVMQNLAVAAFDLPRGNVLAYYPEANVLIGLEQDPRSLTPAFKSVPVALEVV